MNAQEKEHLVKVGWKYEGIGWYSDENKTIPLYASTIQMQKPAAITTPPAKKRMTI